MDTDAAPPAERRHALHAWLPPPLAEAAAQTDLANWEAALKAFSAAWRASASAPDADRALATLPWVAIFNK